MWLSPHDDTNNLPYFLNSVDMYNTINNKIFFGLSSLMILKFDFDKNFKSL